MSEQYIVSARKYRPQVFDTVVGQEHITTTLKNAIKTQHLAHAYLFCGPRGVGKTSCARILAKTINCENPTSEMEACGECSTCISFKENSSFNVFELDAASNNSVDDIRRLTEQVKYAPQHGKYKIYIIDEVHMLSTAAFNAFLKTLEEPPAYAIFILATTEKHKILPTILSRCQIFDFKRIQTEDIVKHLASICAKENMQSENAALHIIAQKSEGCMRDALSMMDRIAGFSAGNLSYAQVVEHLNILDAEAYFKLSDMLLSKDIGSSLLYLDEILQKGFEGDLILNGFAEHFRNLLLSKDGRMARLIDLPEEHKRNYFNHAQLIPQAYVLSALSLLNDAEIGYKNAINKRMHLELALIRLCYLTDLTTPSQAISDGDFQKKKPVNEPSILRNEGVKETVSIKEETVISPVREDADNYQPKPILQAPENVVKTEREPKLQNAALEEKKPTKGPPPKRKGSSLSALQQDIVAHSGAAEAVVMTQESADALFQEYKDSLKGFSHEHPAVAQLNMIQVKCFSGDELQFVCNSEINLAYGQNKSSDFREFCNNKIGIKNLRITTFLDETALPKEPQVKILNKMETFELMVAQNENLLHLKNALNLNVDY